jgi:hypothetical protein
MPPFDVVDRLWDQVEPTVFITREQFVAGLVGWDIEAVLIDGRLAFAVLVKGPEFHFASFDSGTAISRAMIRQRLDPIIERHGFVVTRTPKEGADRQHRFNKAFGFRAIGEDEFFITYRMDRKCP